MISVIKASGEKELFSEEKLASSIRRAGIPKDLQHTVASHVKEKLYEGIKTSEIYNHITEFFKHSNYPYANARYSLKQSIMELGPSGYPFEDYLARILTCEGYATQVRQILPGSCITHEIDVVLEKQGARAIVEAKYHNRPGIKTTVHVSLYTKARFDDIKTKNNIGEAWLVSNTTVTIDAIAFANCVGMKVISWNYPNGGSLRELIEKHHLFPVTALTTISLQQKQQLLNNHVVLCKQICENKSLIDSLSLSDDQKKRVYQETSFVCQSSS